MIQFFLFLMKIIFSIISSYIIIYFLLEKHLRNIHYQRISILSLFGSSILSLMFLISSNVSDYSLFSLAIFLFFLITYSFIKNFSRVIKNLYILSFCSTIIISCGYVLYSLVLIGIFYYIIKNPFIDQNEENDLTKNQIDENNFTENEQDE